MPALLLSWAAGCHAPPAISEPAPRRPVVWGGVGVDTGDRHKSPFSFGPGAPGTFSSDHGFGAVLDAAIAALIAEATKSDKVPSEGVAHLMAGIPAWEAIQRGTDRAFRQALSSHVPTAMRSASTTDQPTEKDDVVLAEIGPAYRAGPGLLHVRVRLLIYRASAQNTVEERWTQPFRDVSVWDDRSAKDFEAVLTPAVTELCGSLFDVAGH